MNKPNPNYIEQLKKTIYDIRAVTGGIRFVVPYMTPELSLIVGPVTAQGRGEQRVYCLDPSQSLKLAAFMREQAGFEILTDEQLFVLKAQQAVLKVPRGRQ